MELERVKEKINILLTRKQSIVKDLQQQLEQSQEIKSNLEDQLERLRYSEFS